MGATLSQVADVARAAEAVGFDALWAVEAGHDPFFPCLLAAEHTSRIEVGTAVAIAFPRSPMVIAQIAWDLQTVSAGRFLLGLGTQVKGHNERRYSVKWEAPVRKLREVVLSLRAIWDCWQNGSRLDFRGEFYTFTLMTPFFNPGPISHPHIPIYLSGLNPRMCQLAGELCEGFHVHPFHTVKYLREVVLPNIGAGLARAGRQRHDIQLATMAFVVTGRNAAELEAARVFTRQQIAFYASTRTYRRVLEVHGWEETCRRLNEKAARGQWEKMPAEISDEMLETFAVVAPREEVGLRLRERYAGLVDRLALYNPYRPGEDDEFWRRVVRQLKDG